MGNRKIKLGWRTIPIHWTTAFLCESVKQKEEFGQRKTASLFSALSISLEHPLAYKWYADTAFIESGWWPIVLVYMVVDSVDNQNDHKHSKNWATTKN